MDSELPLSSSNGVYRECLRNHAASLGGHALDGCGEFFPSPSADPAMPSSLVCAACGCHRNFHRRRRRRRRHLPPSSLSSSSDEDPPAHTLLALRAGELPRKRFRTKFTPAQKAGMLEISERIGWRMRRCDEGFVEERCREIGVAKGVFKVWMHNNKHPFRGGASSRRRERDAAATGADSGAGEGGDGGDGEGDANGDDHKVLNGGFGDT